MWDYYRLVLIWRNDLMCRMNNNNEIRINSHKVLGKASESLPSCATVCRTLTSLGKLKRNPSVSWYYTLYYSDLSEFVKKIYEKNELITFVMT